MSKLTHYLGLGLLSSSLWLTGITVPPSFAAPETSPVLIAANRQATLTTSDLPTGFQLFPQPGRQQMEAGVRSSPDLDVQSIFAYLNPNTVEIGFGFTAAIPSRAEQTQYDRDLNRPDLILQSFIEGFNSSGSNSSVLGSQAMQTGVIGNRSAGISVLTDIGDGMVMRVDGVTFRREDVAAFLFVMYPENITPSTTAVRLSRRLDSKLTQ